MSNTYVAKIIQTSAYKFNFSGRNKTSRIQNLSLRIKCATYSNPNISINGTALFKWMFSCAAHREASKYRQIL